MYKRYFVIALLAIVTLWDYDRFLLGGTAIVEITILFPGDGVGKMANDAITMRDYPVMQAYVIWRQLNLHVINLGTDTALPWTGSADSSLGERNGKHKRKKNKKM